ncbi:glycosyltransferase family 2 protein [Candidatus Omnitrophota bacterium]
MTISVVVPTYCRPESLRRCLAALSEQTRLADEILVVIRENDTRTENFLKTIDLGKLRVRALTVNHPGLVAALNVGVDAVRGDIVAFTDDDAVPRRDWLERIERYFESDPHLGGLGGRDLNYHGDMLETGATKVVGKLRWFGLLLGDHHLGFGEPREADHFKGVNMSFRKTAIGNVRFDRRLRGTGAQFCCDTGFSLGIKRKGWKFIYDPEILVDHYVRERTEETRVHSFDADLKDVSDAAYNDALTVFEYFGFFKRLVYIFLVVFHRDQASSGCRTRFAVYPAT